MIGKIIKIHSDFYYAKTSIGIVECKIREILKKENIEVCTGDDVKLEDYKPDSNQAAIVELLPRKNHIPRPSVSNVDQIIIVTALKEPPLDFTQLNRYICQAVFYKIPVLICVNKCDLVKDEKEIESIRNIYESLGYEIIFTSALKHSGIESLKSHFAYKISVLCGASGVGKSSILNSIQPDLHLKTSHVSFKSHRGTHTTRHSEIIRIGLSDNTKERQEFAEVIDTPGFSYLKFDRLLPEEVDSLFPEIKKYSAKCKFNDCLHLNEEGCNVLKNINKIHSSRYASYKEFVSEANEYKDKLSEQSNKEEGRVKTIDAGNSEKLKIVKLGTKSREKSRKIQKQKLNISTLEDAYYNSEEDL